MSEVSKLAHKQRRWYNSQRVQLLFTLSSHMLFIYVSFYLLKDLVRWEKVLKVTDDNTRKVRLLVAFFSIVIGYILSSFFISLYHLWQEALRGLL
ncbi:TPA: DUF1146 family protein [Streptococcus pneumoniae]